jgi:hypothetical protein
MDLFQVKGTKLAPLRTVVPTLEREIQRLLEANLETVFGMRLVASEYSTGQSRLGDSPEGVLAGKHFVGHHPQGEDVAPLVRWTPVDLLGGHISRVAYGSAGLSRGAVVTHAGAAEVGMGRPVGRGENNVFRRYVPVDDPLPVGKREGVQELLQNVQGGCRVDSTSVDELT